MKEIEVIEMIVKNKIKDSFTNKHLLLHITKFEPNTSHPNMYLFKCDCEVTEGIVAVHKFNGFKASFTGRIGSGRVLFDAMTIDGIKYTGDEKISAKLKELTV